MRFQPKTEEEIQSMNLLEEGTYDFQVIDAIDTLSKANNEMIKLTLKIWDKNGLEKIMDDFLLEKMAFKLRHFSECTGLLEKYETGQMNSHDCIGKSGKLEIKIDKGKPIPNDPDGRYFPDKNSVKDYIKQELKELSTNKDESPFDDEIPF